MPYAQIDPCELLYYYSQDELLYILLEIYNIQYSILNGKYT